jgi:NADP-dependent 3-hydroxy acid dehydrogenase YdfG
MDVLKGSGAVVTGATSGIGKAITTAFIEAGASVVLCDLDAEALDAAARDLGDHATGRVTDVSDEGQGEPGHARALHERHPDEAGGCAHGIARPPCISPRTTPDRSTVTRS